MAWDEDKKAKAIKMYTEASPTAENSAEILKEVSEALKESVNGVRMILSKAGVYVKVVSGTGEKKAGATGEKKAGGTRVSKEESHARLKELLEEGNFEIDEEIVSKLTGKAAVYFANILQKVV
jgi:hypothetical protein